jgi:hypothetical protein
MFPAVDYPVIGLAEPKPAPRWMEFFEGSPTAPPWMVWLAHGNVRDVRGSAWILVGTGSKRLHSELLVARGDDPEDEYVFRLLWGFLNRMAGPHLRISSLSRGIEQFIELNPPGGGSWQTTEWTVDDRPVVATFLRFADAWVAYATDLEEVRLAAIGTTTEPAGLRFAATDGRDYGVDLSSPLDYPQILIDSHARVLPTDAPEPDWPAHPDYEHLRALGDERSS